MTELIQESATPNLCRFEDLPDGPFRHERFPRSLFFKVRSPRNTHLCMLDDGSVYCLKESLDGFSNLDRFYPVRITSLEVEIIT